MNKDSINFRDVTSEHIEIIYNWRNELSIRKVMYNSDFLKWEEHINWFESLLKDDSRFMKILYYEDIPYGIANFYYSDCKANVGNWGFYIGDKNAPKGMGKVLAYAMLEFLFYELNVRKVSGEVLEFNSISINFHEKIGFTKEGVLRKHILKNEQFYDVYLYSIFKNEWEEKKVDVEKIFVNK